MIQFHTFASGSAGNCGLLSDGETHILIDAGISYRRIKTALSEFSLTPGELSGVLVTHEHSDHIAALAMFMKYSPVPVWTSRLTGERLLAAVAGIRPRLRLFEPGEGFQMGEWYINSFATPHDAAGSVGFHFSRDGRKRMGYATDLGHMTETVLEGLSGAELVVLEANHDPVMLRCGPYPYPLKQRIAGDYGHLANEACGETAAELVCRGTKQLVLAHLSRENNTPAVAMDSVCACLQAAGIRPGGDVTVDVAPAAERGRCCCL